MTDPIVKVTGPTEIIPNVVKVVPMPGLEGPKGDQGIQGEQGIQGIQGEAATVNIGTVSNPPYGSPATVTNSGNENDAVFNFDIPGGKAATVTIGTTSTLGPDKDANVYNTGTSTDAVLNFEIPQGEQGVQGIQGLQGEIGFSAFKYDSRRVLSNQYVPGEIIEYEGQYYVCIASNDAIIPNAMSIGIYWNPYSFVGPQGPQGETGYGTPEGGLEGQLLAKASDLNYDFEWIDNYTSTLKHIVKAEEYIDKGQAVYVSSANGTNMLVKKASNISEQTSSKTLGLLQTSLNPNDQGYVITEGLLSGLNIVNANPGDPVWLGSDGNLIYGLTNKPYAPQHLVFIGIVTRVQQNNGEIFVKVQNGFELNELHDLDVKDPSNNDIISYDSLVSLWKKTSHLKINQISESVYEVGSQSGIITHNCSKANKLYFYTLTDNIIPNLTNLGIDDGKETTIEVIVEQGLQAYGPILLQIDGVYHDIKWEGGFVPTGNPNKTDVFEFTILKSYTGNITVLGKLKAFEKKLSTVSGGTIFSDTEYYYSVFTSSDSLTVSDASIIGDMLFVAGGGGGSSYSGGGAGHVIERSNKVLGVGTYLITVGAGGTPGGYTYNASNGSDTEFIGIDKALGGGYAPASTNQGGDGGSGGGGGTFNPLPGNGISGGGTFPGDGTYGNPGGTGYRYYGTQIGGGGGGAGSPGFDALSGVGSLGGSGRTSSLINSISLATGYGEGQSGLFYFGGGGGGLGAVGGIGGGGDGGSYNANPPGTEGAPNTGGGGGGGGSGSYSTSPQWGMTGKSGGSGIFVFRYKKSSVTLAL